MDLLLRPNQLVDIAALELGRHINIVESRGLRHLGLLPKLVDAHAPSVKAVPVGRVWRVDVELRLGVVQTVSTSDTRVIHLSIQKIGLVNIVRVKQPTIESSQLVVNLVAVRAAVIFRALQLGPLDVFV